METHLHAKPPVSIVMAIPDHPWTKASADAAAVRIAMTVVAAGAREGTLREVVREAALDTEEPIIAFAERSGIINSDLTVGVDITTVVPLKANEGVCSPGVKLHGTGFIVTPQKAEQLGLGKRPDLERHVREYRNGRDLMSRARGVLVIDLFGLDADEVRHRFPEVYQHVLATVKSDREVQYRKSPTKDAEAYVRLWWMFGKPRQELRPALDALPRYIATVETAKHRVFQFLDAAVLPDNKLIAIASDDAFVLGVLSSRFPLRAEGWLGVGNDPVYVKSSCFDLFPFPAANGLQEQRIRTIAEELDAHRKRVLANGRRLTVTGLYNVLEKLRAGTMPEALVPTERRIFDDGLVLILKELHDQLDAAVAYAYAWPIDLGDEDILARLVALNLDRAKDEPRGQIRWLRPEYQVPRFGTAKEKAELDLVGGATAIAGVAGPKPSFPVEDVAQTAAVMSAPTVAFDPMDGSCDRLDLQAGSPGRPEGRRGPERACPHRFRGFAGRRAHISTEASRMTMAAVSRTSN